MERELKVPRLDYDRILVSEGFIKSNNLKLKSQEDIGAEFVRIIGENNMFEFRTEILIYYISFQTAKRFLKESAVKEYESGKEEWTVITDINETVQDFLDYMVFAWGKAEDERGISASRSISKLSVWLWMLGRQDLVEKINDSSLYNPYGAPALIVVCEELGIKVPESLKEFAGYKV